MAVGVLAPCHVDGGDHAAPCGKAMGRPPLVICGVALANSVDATVRVAANLGFKVSLPANACWSCDKRDLGGRVWPAEDVHQLTLALLDGEYATITTTEAVLAA